MASAPPAASGPFTATPMGLQKLIEAALDSRNKTTVETEVMSKAREQFGEGGLAEATRALHSDAENGISTKEIPLSTRQSVFGKNSLPEPPTLSLLERMLEAAKDPTVIILCGCACLSLGLGLGVEQCFRTGWVEGCAILFAVLVVVLVSAVNDWQKDRQFRALNAVKDDVEINVVRDGKQTRVSTHDIVVGDVVELTVGDMLCADGLFLFGSGLKISESAMTGETDDMKKGEYVFSEEGDMKVCPFLFGGTMVMEGTGRMMVIAVGTSSYIGATRSKMQESSEGMSVLQTKLTALAEGIGKIAFVVACLVFVVLLIRFAVQFGRKDTDYLKWNHSKHWRELLGFLITAVTVCVVAVPEGLPLAVVISLAFSVKKMLQDNNLVRHLSACETMGGATTICSDKTGTLTMNRMAVMKAWAAEKIVGFDGEGLPPKVKELIVEAVALNSSARLEFPVSGPPEHIGNKTECGLLQFCHSMKLNYDEYRAQHKEVHPIVFAFSSKRKRMSTLWDWGDGTYRLFTKGAPEAMLEVCTRSLDESGNDTALEAATKKRLLDEVIDAFANDSLRTLCVGSRIFRSREELPNSEDPEEFEKNLTCLAIVGIEDPVRPEVPQALLDCRRAGIMVRMVTGDNIITARAIARKCGIAAQMDNFLALEGAEFRRRVLDDKGEMVQAEIDKIWPTLLVLARSSPLDKHTLVSGIMASTALPVRQVVAVTGDGTNDGPALKKADVGFAMGITGTSVAKDAADIILMDDNFTSIVKAVKWGRCVYDNICKFLQFQLTVNIVAVVVAFIGAASSGMSPLRAIHLLWINLIMDSLASLALSTETPTDALLNRHPYGRTKPLLSPVMLRNMILHAVYQIVIVQLLVWRFDGWMNIASGRPEDAPKDEDHCRRTPTEHYTMVFNAFVWMQLFNEVNSHRINNEANVFENLLSSPYFIGVVGVTTGLQIILVEFGGLAFSTTPLNGLEWGVCIAIGAFELVWYQIIRFFPSSVFEPLSNLIRVGDGESGETEGKNNKVHPEEEKGTELQPFSSTSTSGGAGVAAGTPVRLA